MSAPYPAEILKAADIAAMEGKSRAHLLNPDAIRVSRSLGSATGLEQDVCDYPRKKKRLYMNGAEDALVDLRDVNLEPPA